MKPEPILPTHSKCKGYFAGAVPESVKSILPPVSLLTIDKHCAESIMRLSIRRVAYPVMPGSGGLNGHIDTIWPQKRLSAPTSQPESSPRTGLRPSFPDTSLLRSPRFGASETRNAATGQPGTSASHHSGRAIRLFAGDLLSGGASFCCRRAARAAATPQRTPAGVQIIRKPPATIRNGHGDN